MRYGQRWIGLFSVLALLLLYSAAIATWSLLPNWHRWLGGSRFEAEQWQQWQPTALDCCRRWQMLGSLRRQYRLIGRSRAELTALLGPPDRSTRNQIHYGLGYTGRGIAAGTLTLHFDARDQVMRIEIRQH